MIEAMEPSPAAVQQDCALIFGGPVWDDRTLTVSFSASPHILATSVLVPTHAFISRVHLLQQFFCRSHILNRVANSKCIHGEAALPTLNQGKAGSQGGKCRQTRYL